MTRWMTRLMTQWPELRQFLRHLLKLSQGRESHAYRSRVVSSLVQGRLNTEIQITPI